MKNKVLVVDTAAFIKRVPLWELAEGLVSVIDVLREIKDKQTLNAVQSLPVPVEYEEPHPKYIKFINEFSKKTGDYAVLSAADVKIVALAYQKEVEMHGDEHLRKEPLKKITNTQVSVPIAELDAPNEALEACSQEETDSYNTNKDNAEAMESAEEEDDSGGEWSHISRKKKKSMDVDNDSMSVTSSKQGKSSSEYYGTLLPGFYISKEKSDQDLDDDDEESDDEEDYWITPDNVNDILQGKYTKYQKTIFDEESDDEFESSVGCITADFAMQNVLRQIGLKVLGVDGKVIRDTRSYSLRCFSCFKLCADMTKMFCPKCGNRTLKRVAVTYNADGTQNIWISKRPINIRHTKFNLPKPRGGRNAVLPLLTADQRFPHQWAKKKNNSDHLDNFLPGSSPFAQHDVTSKAYKLGNVRNTGINGQLKHAKIWKPKCKRFKSVIKK